RQLATVGIGREQALAAVHDDPATVLDQADKPAFGGCRGDVPAGHAARAAREAAVGDQRAGLAEAPPLEEGRGVEHLLHARAALWALVARHPHAPGLDALVQELLDRLLPG